MTIMCNPTYVNPTLNKINNMCNPGVDWLVPMCAPQDKVDRSGEGLFTNIGRGFYS